MEIEQASEILHKEFGVDVGFGFPPMYKRVVGRAHPEWFALFIDIVQKRWDIARRTWWQIRILPPHGDMADDRIRELVAQRKRELGVETIVVPVEEVLYNNAKFLKLSEKAKEYFEKRMKELWG
jgi:tRNA(His) 5'-end guanylyltransferase